MNIETLSVINLIITITVACGGIMAYRHGFAKAAGEIQERVINALNSELASMKDRITELESANKKLRGFMRTITLLLKKHNLSLTIDGDTVILHDDKSNSSIMSVNGEDAI